MLITIVEGIVIGFALLRVTLAFVMFVVLGRASVLMTYRSWFMYAPRTLGTFSVIQFLRFLNTTLMKRLPADVSFATFALLGIGSGIRHRRLVAVLSRANYLVGVLVLCGCLMLGLLWLWVNTSQLFWIGVQAPGLWSAKQWAKLVAFLNRVAAIVDIDELEVGRLFLFRYGGTDSSWQRHKHNRKNEYFDLLLMKMASGQFSETRLQCWMCLATFRSEDLQCLWLSQSEEAHVDTEYLTGEVIELNERLDPPYWPPRGSDPHWSLPETLPGEFSNVEAVKAKLPDADLRVAYFIENMQAYRLWQEQGGQEQGAPLRVYNHAGVLVRAESFWEVQTDEGWAPLQAPGVDFSNLGAGGTAQFTKDGVEYVATFTSDTHGVLHCLDKCPTRHQVKRYLRRQSVGRSVVEPRVNQIRELMASILSTCRRPTKAVRDEKDDKATRLEVALRLQLEAEDLENIDLASPEIEAALFYESAGREPSSQGAWVRRMESLLIEFMPSDTLEAFLISLATRGEQAHARGSPRPSADALDASNASTLLTAFSHIKSECSEVTHEDWGDSWTGREARGRSLRAVLPSWIRHRTPSSMARKEAGAPGWEMGSVVGEAQPGVSLATRAEVLKLYLLLVATRCSEAQTLRAAMAALGRAETWSAAKEVASRRALHLKRCRRVEADVDRSLQQRPRASDEVLLGTATEWMRRLEEDATLRHLEKEFLGLRQSLRKLEERTTRYRELGPLEFERYEKSLSKPWSMATQSLSLTKSASLSAFRARARAPAPFEARPQEVELAALGHARAER